MREFKVLHVETTDVCQAACPQCARETDAEFDKSSNNQLTIDHILNHFTYEQLAQLDKIFACGNYGDPAAGKHTLSIFEEIRRINPTITLGMNTNGALRTIEWWASVGYLFTQPEDYVVFSIDGLEDTNHIYRKNVNWNKLMDNAQAFINAGGSAHWDMLVYRHNEHQLEAAEQLAKDMGFKWFRAKASKRPMVDGLQRATGFTPMIVQAAEIDCHALKEKSFYIDAQGRLHPCCWLGSRQSNFITDFEAIKESWKSEPHPVCKSNCGLVKNQSRFEAQWYRNVQF